MKGMRWRQQHRTQEAWQMPRAMSTRPKIAASGAVAAAPKIITMPMMIIKKGEKSKDVHTTHAGARCARTM